MTWLNFYENYKWVIDTIANIIDAQLKQSGNLQFKKRMCVCVA